MQDQEMMECLIGHFSNLLMPRSKGLITVVKTDPASRSLTKTKYGNVISMGTEPGFAVYLGAFTFLTLRFNDETIDLTAAFPACLAAWDKQMQAWRPVICQIKPVDQITGAPYIADPKTVSFDVFLPDSITKAEYYVQHIITKIKYMVSNQGWYGMRPKEDLDLTDPIESATKAHNAHLRKSQRRKR